MDQPRWQLVFYRTDSGKYPYLDFFFALGAKDQNILRRKLERVAQYGPKVGADCRSIRDGIWEMRLPLGSCNARLFFFYQPERVIVVTHGMCKKGQKAQTDDISLAIDYRDDHVSRGGT